MELLGQQIDAHAKSLQTLDRDNDGRADDLQIEPSKASTNDITETSDEEQREPGLSRDSSESETRHPFREQDRVSDKLLTEEEFRQLLNARERELTEAQKQRDAERAFDRSKTQDRSLGLAD